ncbi:MAG: hypothetical protein PWR10_1800 [Halanaerobiales bacterium]|nr:hypothetical protein [Halanaerobiales bacterium]
MTIYEYISFTQPDVLEMLLKLGLLAEKPDNEPANEEEELTFADIVALMRHDKWKRVRGALRQIHSGRVFL